MLDNLERGRCKNLPSKIEGVARRAGGVWQIESRQPRSTRPQKQGLQPPKTAGNIDIERNINY